MEFSTHLGTTTNLRRIGEGMLGHGLAKRGRLVMRERLGRLVVGPGLSRRIRLWDIGPSSGIHRVRSGVLMSIILQCVIPLLPGLSRHLPTPRLLWVLRWWWWLVVTLRSLLPVMHIIAGPREETGGKLVRMARLLLLLLLCWVPMVRRKLVTPSEIKLLVGDGGCGGEIGLGVRVHVVVRGSSGL